MRCTFVLRMTPFVLDRRRDGQLPAHPECHQCGRTLQCAPFAVRLVSLWKFNPMTASTDLLAVSNTLRSYGMDRASAKKRLEDELRFRTDAS